jgi:hypothetical protein
MGSSEERLPDMRDPTASVVEDSSLFSEYAIDYSKNKLRFKKLQEIIDFLNFDEEIVWYFLKYETH